MNPRRPSIRRSTPRFTLPLRLASGLVAALVLLAACGAPTPSAAIELALGSDAIAVLRGGSVDVDVVVTRTGGATGSVALSVTGLPANVSASFAPPTLDGAAMTSVLTLSATAAASDGASTLTVAADGASLASDATLGLDVESLSVAGRVVGFFEIPFSGAAVASQGATTFTDPDGTFVLDGLAVPFDLTLSAAVGSGAVHVFEGLTTASPVLTPLFVLDLSLPPNETAAVSGDVLGGAVVGANRVVIVCAEGLDLVAFGCGYADPGDTTYQVDPSWYGPTTTTIRLHALHVEFAPDDTPAAFLGYETFDLSLTDGDVVARDLALTPVSSVLVEGSIEAAAGMVVSGLYGSVRFGPRLSMLNFMASSTGGDVSLLVPTPPGASYDLTAVANGPNGPSYAWAVAQSGDFGTLEVPAPLAMGTPADAAVGVDLTTPFTSSGSDEVRTYLFEGSGPSLAITTNRASVTVPDPADGGFAFPSGAAYSWYALGHGITDADAALSRSLLDYYSVALLLNAGGPGFDQSGSFSFGTGRDFTFEP